MKDKLLPLLGLAKKAGRVTLGHDIVLESISKKKSALVLITSDCSPKSVKDIKEHCERSNVPVREIDLTKDRIKQFFNKEYGIISVDDKGFAKKMLSLLAEN